MSSNEPLVEEYPSRQQNMNEQSANEGEPTQAEQGAERGGRGKAALGALAGAWGGVQTVAAGAREKIGQHHEVVKDGYNSLLEKVQATTEEGAEALKDAGFGIADKTSTAWAKSKKDAEKKLYTLSEPLRYKVMLALRENVKSNLAGDPDMCECVKHRLEKLVDLFWDDLMRSVEYSVEDSRKAIGGRGIKDADGLALLGDRPTLCSPKWFRAGFLYHLVPYDLSVFGNLRDPWFYVEMVFMCLPSFSFLPPPFNKIPVRVPYFIVYLICVVTGCPADEFQLVLYIMSVKGLQFVTSGVGLMCYAAFQYFMCVHPDGTHTCAASGPGAKIPLVISLVDWFGISILVWVAFLWLPCSTRSAGLREMIPEQLQDEEADTAPAAKPAGPESRGCCGVAARDNQRGGRLTNWLKYDFLIFCLSIVVCYLIMCVDFSHLRPGGKASSELPGVSDLAEELAEKADEWTGHAAIYWARIIYALLSFPFMFFWIPGLQGILTHTRTTGYNRNGVCVPYTVRSIPKDADKDG